MTTEIQNSDFQKQSMRRILALSGDPDLEEYQDPYVLTPEANPQPGAVRFDERRFPAAGTLDQLNAILAGSEFETRKGQEEERLEKIFEQDAA